MVVDKFECCGHVENFSLAIDNNKNAYWLEGLISIEFERQLKFLNAQIVQ